MGEGEHLLDELVDGPVVVRPRRVDVEEEPLEEGALARRDLDQPPDEEQPRAEVGVHHRPGALEHEAAHELGVAERQLLRDDAAAGEAGDEGGANVERAEDTGRVVRHHLHGDGSFGPCRPPRPAVVEGGQAVAVGEPVELELPRLDGVAGAADQQDVRSFADLFSPDVEVAGAYVLAHVSALVRLAVPARHVLGVGAQVGAGLEEAVVEVQV